MLDQAKAKHTIRFCRVCGLERIHQSLADCMLYRLGASKARCVTLGALAMLACAAPLASGSGDLCDRALHVGWVEYELMDVPYEIEGGEFLGFCVSKEYGIFDVFLEAGPGGELDLEIPAAPFDPRQFEGQVCDFGYGVNGSGSNREGVRAYVDYSTDRSMTVQFEWNARVSQISYAKSPISCLEKYDARDLADEYSGPLSGWLGPNRQLAHQDAICSSPGSHIVHLDYAISGGVLDRVCSLNELRILFDISPDTYGELVVDMPNDVFPIHRTGFDKRLDIPVGGWHDGGPDELPFSITTWNKYGFAYNSVEFSHTDNVSGMIGCLPERYSCIPIPFFRGGAVHKISSHPTFDRYSIPFGPDDSRIAFFVNGMVIDALYYGYHPERYAVSENEGHFCKRVYA